MKKTGKIIQWIIAGFFGTMIIATGFHFSSLFILLAAFLMAPIVRGKILKNIFIIALAVILFFVGVLTSPSAEPTADVGGDSSTVSSTDQNSTSSVLSDESESKESSDSGSSESGSGDGENSSSDTTHTESSDTSKKPENSSDSGSSKPSVSSKDDKTNNTSSNNKPNSSKPTDEGNSSVNSGTNSSNSSTPTVMVWIPKTGKKYHSKSNCGTMKNPSSVSLKTAEKRGYTPCSKCY